MSGSVGQSIGYEMSLASGPESPVDGDEVADAPSDENLLVNISSSGSVRAEQAANEPRSEKKLRRPPLACEQCRYGSASSCSLLLKLCVYGKSWCERKCQCVCAGVMQ